MATTRHFEVYSQDGETAARTALIWFEHLHDFLGRQTGLNVETESPVRVVGFRSAAEYEPYRLRPSAAAYYIGNGSESYIVMPSLAASQYGVAAHEYAHAVLHASGYHLPPWLSEGLAEIFSTVRISPRGSTIGGDRPEHSQQLKRARWIPLSRLLDSAGSGEDLVFYAESWALVDMLLTSPGYASRFPLLITRIASGSSAPQAFAAVYSKTLDSLSRDLHAWTEHGSGRPVALPAFPSADLAIETQILSAHRAQSLMAGLLLAGGALDRAQERYRALAAESPDDADVFAALGTIALRLADTAAARRDWSRAIGLGVRDAGLCYRYAVLASDAGIPADEIRPALERAVALRPDFDDARYMLSLLEKNAGRYAEALAQLRSMRTVPPQRAFAYWTAIADALNCLGRNDDAAAAARQAAQYAKNPDERQHAATLAYVANTELTVRLAQGRDGQPRAVMTRIPRGNTDWNPFIQPQDDVRRVSGNLREIDCTASVTRFIIENTTGIVRLAIPDAAKLLVRNGPPEFTCGPQNPAPSVEAVYAAGPSGDVPADGVLRAIEFR